MRATSVVAVACVCASLSGCLGGFLIGLGQGAHQRIEEIHCRQAVAAGEAVVRFSGTTVPPADGEASLYAPAAWQSGLHGVQVPGRLAIAARAVVFLPEPGYDGVRIPNVLIRGTWLDRSTIGHSPRRLVVELRCEDGQHAFAVFAAGSPPALDAAAMLDARERVERARQTARIQ